MSDGVTTWINLGILGLVLAIAMGYVIFNLSSCAFDKAEEQQNRITKLAETENISNEEAEKKIVEKEGVDWILIGASFASICIAFLVFCFVPGGIGEFALFYIFMSFLLILCNLCGCDPLKFFS